MDTKWKNRISIISWLILLTFGISGVLTSLFNNHEYLKLSYFHTSEYYDYESTLVEYVKTFEISYQSKEDALKKLSVSKEEIDEYRYQNGDLSEQISTIEQEYEGRINNAMASENQTVIDFYIKERDKKIEEITKSFENEEQMKEQIMNEKKQQIDEYYQELNRHREEFEAYSEAFMYYLKDTKTGKVYTNLPSEEVSEVDKFINKDETFYYREYPRKNEYGNEGTQLAISDYGDLLPINTDLESLSLEGEIALSKEVSSTNPIIAHYQDYKNQQKMYGVYTLIAALSLIISVIIGRKKSMLKKIAPEKWKGYYQKIPIDVAIIIFCITTCIAIILIVETNFIYYDFLLSSIVNYVLIMTLFVGVSLIQGIYLFSRLQRPLLQKEVWKNALLIKLVLMVRNAFLNRRVGTQVCIILTIVFLFGAGTLLVMVFPVFLIIYVPAFFLVALPLFLFILKRTGYFNEILLNTNALANGQFKPDLKIIGKSVFAKLAQDINVMKHGVKTSQKAQAKSEKLKTELITNVSHDLRTPLTSIITYTELLKNPALAEDERKSYIDIIDRKSKRLKVLIDDLFEASKMASGNINLTKEKIDIVQLLQQALAEYNETIQQSELTFRITKPSSPVYASVDGQKLWRVFENLIGNILKYSLEHTRAFIHIKVKDGKAIITFKNVSRYELSEDTDELIERFKRGDKSRHTDGSGLGLAIAKSIIDLHEGTLDLDVDGDLFKVTIVLELMEE